MKYKGACHIGQQAHTGNAHHEQALDRFRLHQTLVSLIKDEKRQEDQNAPVDLSGKDLQAVEAKGGFVRRGLGGKSKRNDAQEQGEDIGQHVGGVTQ